ASGRRYALMQLIFSTSCYLLNVHFFPTRRSSDLDRALADRDVALDRVRDGARRRVERRLRLVGHQRRRLVEAERFRGLDELLAPDRNSTRLNSSHDKSSYADFWLIKTTPTSSVNV